jgi:molybdopterin/thiamine biosynthesis adenylyltransferase
MDLSKIEMIFDPSTIKGRIHIIGCGSVGSTLAELLARYGITKFTLYDMDFVESKNIVNQMFFQPNIAHSKVEAMANILCNINPDVKEDLILKPEGWQGETVKGYAFLAVDNIEIRKQFMEKNKYNPNLLGVFDIRTGFPEAQCWSADWSDRKQIENLQRSMAFTHEEAQAATHVSACGIIQGCAPTVRLIACEAIANFINFTSDKGLKKQIIVNPFNLDNAVVAF